MSTTVAEATRRHITEEIATAAFRLATDGRITKVHPWQALLYDRLASAESDAGYLVMTPAGTGKTDAVIIPSVGLQRGGAPRRIFVVAARGCPLDDYVHRLGTYLKAFALADETPRTLYIDESTGELDARGVRFSVDGTLETEISINPLEADVDVVLTTIGRFLDLFFGSGGVHGLPSALALHTEGRIRRDLFFFDEAHSYAPESFSRFLRLVEFLFAEDTDVVVGSSTMPPSFHEELSFLETVRTDSVILDPSADRDPDAAVANSSVPAVTLNYVAGDDVLGLLAGQLAGHVTDSKRVAVVVEDVTDADTLAEALPADLRSNLYRYQPGMGAEARRKVYAELLQNERAGRPYVVLTTGPYFQTSNLDVDVVLTSLCLPESLILRAGRCNRMGLRASGQIAVVGSAIQESTRILNNAQTAAYLEALSESYNVPFAAADWKTFI